MSDQVNLSDLGSDLGIDIENDEISLNQEQTFIAPNLGVTGITYKTTSSEAQDKNRYNKLLEKAQKNKENKNKKLNKVDQMLMISNIVAKNMIKDAMMNQPDTQKSYLMEVNNETQLEKTQFIDNVSDKNIVDNISDYQDQFFENMNVSDLQDETDLKYRGLTKTEIHNKDSTDQLNKLDQSIQSQKLLRSYNQKNSFKQQQDDNKKSQEEFQDISANNRDMSLMRTNLVNQSNWINEDNFEENSLDMSNLDDALDKTEIRKEILKKLEGSTNEQKKENMLSSMVTQHNKGIKFGLNRKRTKDNSFNLQAELIEEETENEEDESKDSVKVSYMQDESLLLSQGAFNRPEKVSTFDKNESRNNLKPIIEQSKENLTSDKDIKSSQNRLWDSRQDSKVSSDQQNQNRSSFGIRRLSNQSDLKSTFNEQLLNNSQNKKQSLTENTPKIEEENYQDDIKEELEDDSELELEDDEIEEGLVDYSKNSIENILKSNEKKVSIVDVVQKKNANINEQNKNEIKDQNSFQQSNQQRISNQSQNNSLLKNMESQQYDFMTPEQEEKLKEFQRRKIDSIQQNFQQDKQKILQKPALQVRRETLQLDLSEDEIEIDEPMSDQELQQIEDFISESNSKGSDNQSQNKLDNDTLIVESVYKKVETNPFKESMYSSKKNQELFQNSKQSSLKSSQEGSLAQTNANRQQYKLMHSTFTEKKFENPIEVITEQPIEQFSTFNPYNNQYQEFSAQQNYFEVIEEPFSPAFDNREKFIQNYQRKISIKKKKQPEKEEEIDDKLLGTAVILPQKSRESIMDLQRKKQFSFSSLKIGKRAQSSNKSMNFIKDDFAHIINIIIEKKIKKRQNLFFLLLQYMQLHKKDFRINIVQANLQKILCMKLRDYFDLILYRGVLKRNAKLKMHKFTLHFRQKNFLQEVKDILMKQEIKLSVTVQNQKQRKQSFLKKILNIERDQSLQLAFKNLELYFNQNKNIQLQEGFSQMYKQIYIDAEVSESIGQIDEEDEYQSIDYRKNLKNGLKVSTFSDYHSNKTDSQNIQIQIIEGKNNQNYQSYLSDQTNSMEKSETVDLNNPLFESNSHRAYDYINQQKQQNQIISFKNNPIQKSKFSNRQSLNKQSGDYQRMQNKDQLQKILNELKKQQKQFKLKKQLDEFEQQFLQKLNAILLLLETIKENIQDIPESGDIIEKTVQVLKNIFESLNQQRKSHVLFKQNQQSSLSNDLEEKLFQDILKLKNLVNQIQNTSSVYQSITQELNMTSQDEISEFKNNQNSVSDILSQNSDQLKTIQVGTYSVSVILKKLNKRNLRRALFRIKALSNFKRLTKKHQEFSKKQFLVHLKNFTTNKKQIQHQIEYFDFLLNKKTTKIKKQIFKFILKHGNECINQSEKSSIKNFVRKSLQLNESIANNKLSTKSLLEQKNQVDISNKDVSKLISLRTVDNNVFFKKEKDDFFYQNLEDEYKQKASRNQSMDFGPNQFFQQI